MFADEHEGQSTLAWFFIVSILLHALLIWLWPQWKASFSSGLGLDQGGIVELVHLPEHPQIMQPNLPPRPAPPVVERPPVSAAPAPSPEPAPQPAPTPPAPPTPAPLPDPQPEPEPEPQPVPEPEPQMDPGQDDDVLVSDRGDFDIAAGPPEERESAPQPPPPPVPEPRREPEGTPELETASEADSVGEPADGIEDGDGDGDLESDVDGGDADEAAAAPPQSAIRGAALGSGKSLDDVGETDVLSDLIVEVHIDADGRVTRVDVVSGSGAEDVDDSMVNQMRRWVAETPPGRALVEVWRVRFELHAVGSTTQWQPMPELLEVR